MNELLKLTIDSHGGISRWQQLSKMSARLKCGGVLWPLKGYAGVLNDIHVVADLKKQLVSHYPFIHADWRTQFESNHVAIESKDGKIVEALNDPRASFKGYVTETPWTRLQLTYFIGYAMWTYFNAPFNFLSAGYKVAEIEPWEENNEIWRRLEVRFPGHIATHSPTQVFYIGSDGLIRRHDYNVDIQGGTAAAHYVYNYTEVSGIMVPAKRLVYARKDDNKALLPQPLIVSIDISEINFS
jgi:hypothetical protein